MVEKKSGDKTKNEKDKMAKSGGGFAEKIKSVPKKYWAMAGGVIGLLIILFVVYAVITMPIGKSEAAEIFAGMLDRRNALEVKIRNDASVLDVNQMRVDAKDMVNVLDENIKLATETKWPEGMAKKEKRLNGKNASDMDIYADNLKTLKDAYQNLGDATDENILKVYRNDMPYSDLSMYENDFRTKLDLPSAVSEKNKYHEYTEDEISEKLQETAVDITLGKFNISCKTEYSYTHCDSSMDAAVRNKSNINFTSGGSIDVTAYDQSGNPIDTETIYLGNRLEKGQTAKQKIFEYIRDEHRSDFQNNPTFKVTKVQIYNY